MSKREQMILLAYKVALAQIEAHIRMNCDSEISKYVNNIVKDLDATILNIETKIDIEV